jgi:putative hydrolase of the HAD superfamily
MINAVLFDLDGTLLDRDRSIKRFAIDQYDRLIHILGHITKEKYVLRFIELDNRGYVWKDRVYQQIIKEFQIHGMEWEDFLKDYLENFKFHCVPFPKLNLMLSELKNNQIKLGIITNGFTEFQMGNIIALGIQDYFDVILISEREGVKKPDIHIFNTALNQLKFASNECFFVGDHPINDIKGAKNAGMITVWKQDDQWDHVECDFRIAQLEELIDLVKENNRVNI